MAKNRRHDIVKPSKYKTSLCTFFASEAGCPFGDKCAFAHGEEELRPEVPKEPKTEGSAADSSSSDSPAAAPAAGASAAQPHASAGTQQPPRAAPAEEGARAGQRMRPPRKQRQPPGGVGSGLGARAAGGGGFGEPPSPQPHMAPPAGPYYLLGGDAVYGGQALVGGLSFPSGFSQQTVYTLNNSKHAINAAPEMLTPFLPGTVAPAAAFGGLPPPTQQQQQQQRQRAEGDGRRVVRTNTRVTPGGAAHGQAVAPQGGSVVMMPYSPFDPAHPMTYAPVGMRPFLVNYGAAPEAAAPAPGRVLGGFGPGIHPLPPSSGGGSAWQQTGFLPAADPSAGGAGGELSGVLGAAAAARDDDDDGSEWAAIIDRWLSTQRDAAGEEAADATDASPTPEPAPAAPAADAPPAALAARAPEPAAAAAPPRTAPLLDLAVRANVSEILARPVAVELRPPPAPAPAPEKKPAAAATAAAPPSAPRRVCAVRKAGSGVPPAGGAERPARRVPVTVNRMVGSCRRGERDECFSVYDATQNTVYVIGGAAADGEPAAPAAPNGAAAGSSSPADAAHGAAAETAPAAAASEPKKDKAAVVPLLGVPILFTKGNRKVLVMGEYSEDDDVDYCI